MGFSIGLSQLSKRRQIHSMDENTLFPGYIHREEERAILQAADKVRQSRESRAVLLYGPGGSGKTWLIRQLTMDRAADEQIVWLDAIDVDDSEYWLLSNLESYIAKQIDPHDQYFGRYKQYISRLPNYARPRIGHETVVSHLARIKRVFQDCYRDYVTQTGKTVVISFDTVETMRGMYLLLTLTQWMKALSATLFVLSGRPPNDEDEAPDPIRNELSDPYQGMPVTTVTLGEFTQDAALRYLHSSSAASLDDDEKAKLVHLTRGHPLWLAFTISYLQDRGMPEEAGGPLDTVRATVPYRGELTPEGQALREAFKRRLVTPYREVDFWHEAIKRLAVVRQRVNQPIWQRLMGDWQLPSGLQDWDEAWGALLRTPWIRPRANRRYVTLHDAVAEELGQRIIPLHDRDLQWRVDLWRRAADIYSYLIAQPKADLDAQLTDLDNRLQEVGEVALPGDEARASSRVERAFVEEVAELDARKHELDQLRAVGFVYRLLCDHKSGCDEFLRMFEDAKARHDVLFQDLLAFEMQRFLPDGVQTYAFGDVVRDVIEDFRAWLRARPGLYREIGLSMADYLINNEQSPAAKDLLEQLPLAGAEFGHRYRREILLANACIRIDGEVRHGLDHCRAALAEAMELRPPECYKHIAEAQKELGFYFRNEGMWREADNAYREARNAISESLLTSGGSEEDREEMASIQTNWAYVKGLEGEYRDGVNLAESAITVRHRLGRAQGEASAWSVCGEVYRYERRFELSWRAYENAEQIFHEQRNWSWLGLIYQEQAICLFQAAQDGVVLTPNRDQLGQAKRLITLALDICHEQAVRGYPSALNRAGRIFGGEDHDVGLEYLARGIDWSRRLSDGWFLFANLIEYVELSYAAWAATGKQRYRDAITRHAGDIAQAIAAYEFPDLRGRWYLVQGHLGIHDWEASEDSQHLDAALAKYAEGFAKIAQGYVGSSGAAAVPGEFKLFSTLLKKLPSDIQADWLRHLRREWGLLSRGSDLLLARLEELH